jgi:hypothetical protein
MHILYICFSSKAFFFFFLLKFYAFRARLAREIKLLQGNHCRHYHTE